MTKKISLLGAALLLAASLGSQAATYTYKYVGPSFTGGTDHVELSFTTSAPLAPSTSYLSAGDAGVVSSVVTVVGPNGVVGGFTLPVTAFQVHTGAAASGTVPGIDAWYVMGDASNLTGTAPTMTGVHFQAYTMNTMAFIPGSDIPGATGLVTGHYDYDQATQTTFYDSCTGIANCQVAGNGQPYVGNYSGIVNPSGTSAANWQLVVDSGTPPPTAPLAVSGTLPGGTVGAAYGASSLAASGGVAPYTWSATGLPAGLSIATSTGVVSGTPTTASTYSLTIQVADSTNATKSSVQSVVIADAPAVACADNNAPISGVNKWWLDVNGGLKSGTGQSVVYAPQSNTVFAPGTTGFAVGELIDYVGTINGNGMCAASTMKVKPGCTKPSTAKSVQAKGKITALGDGYIVVGSVPVQVPTCAVISYNGATGFAVGQRLEYQGYSVNGATVAQKVTVN